MPPSDDLLLGDYLDEWLERRRSQLRPTTLRAYRQAIHAYLRPRLGEIPITELDRRTLERHYAWLLASGGLNGKPLSPRTVRHAHAVLHRALKDAFLDGLVDANPAQLARTPKHDPGDVELDDDLQVWTADQAVGFLDLVDDHPLWALWHLAVGTGCRRGELLGLRWKDVDLAGRRIRVRRALSVVDGVTRLLGTKTSRSRTLSIGGSVVDALRRERTEQTARRRDAGDGWADRWGLVLTEPTSAPIDPMTVTREFRRLVRTLDVPVIRFHAPHPRLAAAGAGRAHQGGQRAARTRDDRDDHGHLRAPAAGHGRGRRGTAGGDPAGQPRMNRSSPEAAHCYHIACKQEGCMKTLQVRNLPDDAHRRLKARAALRGQSLSEFARTELMRSLERPTIEELAERVRQLGPTDVSESGADAVRAERDAR